MTRQKMLILEDDQNLLRVLGLSITKFEVVAVTTVPNAIKELMKGDISFIVADVKLTRGSKGYNVFKELFFKGKSVPGIVFTAFEVDEKTKKILDELGIEEVIPKGGQRQKLYERLELAALKILKDRKKRFHPVTQKIKSLELENTSLRYLGKTKTVKEWLKDIFNKKFTYDVENELKDRMVGLCNRRLVPEGGRPHNFPQIGEE